MIYCVQSGRPFSRLSHGVDKKQKCVRSNRVKTVLNSLHQFFCTSTRGTGESNGYVSMCVRVCGRASVLVKKECADASTPFFLYIYVCKRKIAFSLSFVSSSFHLIFFYTSNTHSQVTRLEAVN